MKQDPLAQQRPRLTATVADKIASAVAEARLPGRVYGLVLAYSLGELGSYVWPLYEVTRQALLEAGKKAHALWDPSWAEDYALPPGVPDDDALIERNIDVPFWADEQLGQAFWRYCGGPPNNDRTYDAMESLWLDVGKRLTTYDWGESLDVTADFVAVAYPMEGTDWEVRRGLEYSLGPERYHEFDARGWIPH